MRRLRVVADFVEHQQAGREAEALCQIVGDHENGQPVLLPQLGNQLMHVLANTGIERAKRFIEQQHARLHHQRLRNGQTLLHAARELMRIFALRLFQSDLRKHCLRALANRLTFAPPDASQPACAAELVGQHATLSSTVRCGNTE